MRERDKSYTDIGITQEEAKAAYTAIKGYNDIDLNGLLLIAPAELRKYLKLSLQGEGEKSVMQSAASDGVYLGRNTLYAWRKRIAAETIRRRIEG